MSIYQVFFIHFSVEKNSIFDCFILTARKIEHNYKTCSIWLIYRICEKPENLRQKCPIKDENCTLKFMINHPY